MMEGFTCESGKDADGYHVKIGFEERSSFDKAVRVLETQGALFRRDNKHHSIKISNSTAFKLKKDMEMFGAVLDKIQKKSIVGVNMMAAWDALVQEMVRQAATMHK